MQTRVIFVAAEGSEQLFHVDCADGKGYSFETNSIPHSVSGFPATDSEACCYACHGFLGYYNAEEQELRRAVFQALDNAVENGYAVDENPQLEAMELIELDSGIETLLGLSGESPSVLATPEQLNMVTRFVVEWKELR